MCFFSPPSLAYIPIHSVRELDVYAALKYLFPFIYLICCHGTSVAVRWHETVSGLCTLHTFKDTFILHQDHGVTFAVMVTMEIQQEGLGQFGHASPVIVTRMLILMLLGIAIEPQESA